MPVRSLLLACLVFSGLSALVYQVLWTRLLGFTFGTSTEAIGTVLAVFFGGMAIGNGLAAKLSSRVLRPLRLYAILELGIGLFALASLPILQHLHWVYGLIGTEHGPTTFVLARIALSALVLLPPTIAMGATLPVVAGGLVERSDHLGRWSAYLYAANTLGAVCGAYLCGFWMIPVLGLTQTVLVAAAVNLAVGALVWIGAGSHPAPNRTVALEEAASAPVPAPTQHASDPGARAWYLAFFCASGFVAIGYEIIWSKAFTIVMEGTLYGFTTVLSAYLFGLGLGSLAISGRVDRLRDPSRTFGLIHIGIGISVALGIALVGDLPYWYMLANPDGKAGIHTLYLIAAPIVILPTALFGAAFPVLLRLYTQNAGEVAKGFGLATALNTGGSIAASLMVSFWWIDSLGIDATLYILLLIEMSVGVAVLLRFQVAEGRRKFAAAGPALLATALVAGSYNGVGIEQAISGRTVRADSLDQYHARIEANESDTKLVIEGRTSVVTVHTNPGGWLLQNNGLPEATFNYAPPYRAVETVLLGTLPYLLAESPERALMIGFGGGSTVDALLRTNLEAIEVVELEGAVVGAIPLLYRGRPSPLEDERIEVRVNDGRNELLMGQYRGDRKYDVIASQPSHPWLAGAANLFTREFFELASHNLADGGVFAIWVNGFHTDAESVLSVIASFDQVFPGSVVVSGGDLESHSSLLLLGALEPITWKTDQIEARLQEPELAAEFAMHGIDSSEDLLARFEGAGAAFAATWDGPMNTDDNTFVETRLSRMRSWEHFDFAEVEKRLPRDAPVLPPVVGELDELEIARSMLPRRGRNPQLGWAGKIGRFARNRRENLGAAVSARIDAESKALALAVNDEMVKPLEALAESRPTDPEPLRAMARHWEVRARDSARSAEAYDDAWKISGNPEDAALAALAWRRVGDPRAWDRLADVPAATRSRFPGLVLVAAEQALAEGASASEVQRHYRNLLALRETREGRAEGGLNAALAVLARAVGDGVSARTFGDADSRERSNFAARAILVARAAVEREDWAGAAGPLETASRLVPGSPEVLELAVLVAAGQGDAQGVRSAFDALRRSAPNLTTAVKVENRLRTRIGLPLLPASPVETLMSRARTTGPPERAEPAKGG